MKAILTEGMGQVALGEIPRPAIGAGDLLLRVQACGICFSDIHKIRYRRLEKPSVLGHEIAGRVVEAGPRVSRFHVGDRVAVAHHVPCGTCHYCRHGNVSMCPEFRRTTFSPGGFSEYLRVPESHVNTVAFRIPDSLSDNEACFMEPLGCCVRNMRRLGLQKKDVAIVVGLGSIGLLLAQLVQYAGATPLGVELDPARRKIAQELGVTACFTGCEPDFAPTLQRLTEGRGADAVIVTAGQPAMVPETLRWLRDGGTLNIFASFHPESTVPLDWNQLYYREINVVSSYSPAPADLAEAMDLLSRGKVRVGPLARHHFSLEKFSEGLEAVEKRAILKAIITPHGNGES